MSEEDVHANPIDHDPDLDAPETVPEGDDPDADPDGGDDGEGGSQDDDGKQEGGTRAQQRIKS